MKQDVQILEAVKQKLMALGRRSTPVTVPALKAQHLKGEMDGRILAKKSFFLELTCKATKEKPMIKISLRWKTLFLRICSLKLN